MKILMVNKFLYPNGGSETYIFKLGKQLIRMGHEVQYFGMEHQDRIVGNSAESYTSPMDFHTGKISRVFYPFKIIYSVEARKKIRKVLKTFDPDVVHLNNFNFQLTPSILYEIKAYSKRNNKKIKIIYTAHDYQWICPNHMMQIPETGELCSRCINGKFSNCTRYRCIHNSKLKSLIGTVEGLLYHKLKTYGMADAIICPSAFLQKMFSVNPILRDKTITMHNFVDDEEGYLPKEKSGSYVLYFGRFAEEKGIRTLAEVCKSLPEIPFVFAGNGPLQEMLQEVSNIKIAGFLKGQELKDVIRNARFVVFPSEWYENCPFSVMEAQMYGTPVLGAAIGGTPELIRENVTGELFASGNREELREKISRLWKNENLCAGYAKGCADLPFDNLESYCMKLLSIYGKEYGC